MSTESEASAEPQTRPEAKRRNAGTELVAILGGTAVLFVVVKVLVPWLNAPSQGDRVGEVRRDIANLENALVSFKLEFGVDPPSSLTFSESGNWTEAAHPDLPRSRALLRRIFPDFRFQAIDLNHDGDKNDRIHLNGSECLVFFLGGVRNPKTGLLEGFSANPLNPFAVGGSRGPFYEFGVSGFDVESGKWTGRFVDLDGDSFPELLDTIAGQKKPYLYFGSIRNDVYWSVKQSPKHPDISERRSWHNSDNYDSASPTDGIPYAYFRSFDPLSSEKSRPYYSKPHSRFQIISPGFDGEYGTGGRFSPRDPSGLSPADQDNITNFHPGQLGKPL